MPTRQSLCARQIPATMSTFILESENFSTGIKTFPPTSQSSSFPRRDKGFSSFSSFTFSSEEKAGASHGVDMEISPTRSRYFRNTEKSFPLGFRRLSRPCGRKNFSDSHPIFRFIHWSCIKVLPSIIISALCACTPKASLASSVVGSRVSRVPGS